MRCSSPGTAQSCAPATRRPPASPDSPRGWSKVWKRARPRRTTSRSRWMRSTGISSGERDPKVQPPPRSDLSQGGVGDLVISRNPLAGSSQIDPEIMAALTAEEFRMRLGAVAELVLADGRGAHRRSACRSSDACNAICSANATFNCRVRDRSSRALAEEKQRSATSRGGGGRAASDGTTAEEQSSEPRRHGRRGGEAAGRGGAAGGGGEAAGRGGTAGRRRRSSGPRRRGRPRRRSSGPRRHGRPKRRSGGPRRHGRRRRSSGPRQHGRRRRQKRRAAQRAGLSDDRHRQSSLPCFNRYLVIASNRISYVS